MATAAREFPYTYADFEAVRALLAEEAGIHLPDAKADMVYSRLARRLRRLRLPDFASYLEHVRADTDGERREFLNALTTNLTAFFREGHHFEHVAETVLPGLPRDSDSWRFWSAGCSTGEEAWSLAITLREALPAADFERCRILATDVDSSVVARGAAGIYTEERVAGLEAPRLRRHFLRGRGRQAGKVRVRPELAAAVRFRQLNLMDEWPFRRRFHAVFCRNVVIYFDRDTQRTLFDRLAEAIEPGGWLYIGHSETLWTVSERFAAEGRTVYRRLP